jgi:hypothetical protein
MAVVYLHRKESDNTIYYVGIGNKVSRAREIRGRSKYWTRVFNKYGRVIDIVRDDIPLEDAMELEMFLIQEIEINNLCNHTLGGEGFFGGKHTEETKRKISNTHKGKKISDEHKASISKAHKGHPNYLKSQSKEARIKIGLASKGRKLKQSSKDIISFKHKKNNHKPSKEALDKSVISRRKNGIRIRELTTNIEFQLYDYEKYFNIRKRTIAENSLLPTPLRYKKHNGLNFIRIKNYTV